MAFGGAQFGVWRGTGEVSGSDTRDSWPRTRSIYKYPNSSMRHARTLRHDCVNFIIHLQAWWWLTSPSEDNKNEFPEFLECMASDVLKSTENYFCLYIILVCIVLSKTKKRTKAPRQQQQQKRYRLLIQEEEEVSPWLKQWSSTVALQQDG